MKINEVITEGPMWDKVQGGIAGWKAGGHQAAGKASATKSAAVSIQHWNELVGQKTQGGESVTPEDLAGFISKEASTSKVPPPADVTNAKAVSDYITKAVSQHIANSKTGVAAPAVAPAATAAPVEPASAEPAAKSEPIKIGGQTLDPNKPADAKMIAQIQAQDAAGTPKTAAANPRTATPTPAEVLSSFRSLEPDEQELVRSKLSQSTPAAPAAEAGPFAAKRAAGATAAQAAMTPKPAAPEAPAAAPAASFAQKAGGYASQTTNAPAPAVPTIQQRPNLGPGKAAAAPSEQDLTKQALDARRKQGLMASKVNKKPAVTEAQLRKMKAKLVVKEMALTKAKRDKGII